jgi:signal transduction histidine kinase
LNILRRTLGDHFAFAAADSGEAALEEAHRFLPDVILLDIMMPGLDGYQVCKLLRARPELASTKIIMVSAKGTTPERLEGYAAGADDYVSKPFEPAELLAKVRVYARLKSVEEINVLKSGLVTLLGHETRTPLTLILTPLSILLDSDELSPPHRKLAEMVDAGARRLWTLVDKVEFLSQLRMRSIPFQIAPMDLDALARTAMERARQRADAAGVTLTLESEGPAPIQGDAEHLGRVLDALLDNAIRFSPEGGRVCLQAGTRAGTCFLTVSDLGPGVDPRVVRQLFQEFAVPDIEHHTTGHGLSLATARHIMDQLDGKIRYDPVAGMNGATFRVELPARTVASHPQTVAAKS